MPSGFKLGNIQLKKASLRDPRVVMRGVIGVLLAANLAAAVIAFKPFGGTDPREQQVDLGRQLSSLEKTVADSKRLVEKVDKARRDGDQFLTKYVTDVRTFSSTIRDSLNQMAQDAGLRALPSTWSTPDPIEGSSTLYMVSLDAGYEGPYSSLRKFVDLLDKSPRFLIIERMAVNAPQQKGGQVVNVNLKLDTFVRDALGATP